MIHVSIIKPEGYGVDKIVKYYIVENAEDIYEEHMRAVALLDAAEGNELPGVGVRIRTIGTNNLTHEHYHISVEAVEKTEE